MPSSDGEENTSKDSLARTENSEVELNDKTTNS